MKNASFVITVFFIVSVSINLHAQSPESPRSSSENSGVVVTSDPTVDPLSPVSIISIVKMVPDSSGYVKTADGRVVKVDGQGVQSLAVPEATSRSGEKNNDEIHRNTKK